ncbi:hypothetical protein EV401DRAFT_2074521 [Pisolithus croceorrhizus]|nr:hypothetical protein EV401DRAFT_2074521 [Pisolithus croceorrhizus]
MTLLLGPGIDSKVQGGAEVAAWWLLVHAFGFSLPWRHRSMKSVGMSSMPFGHGVGATVSSDSSTPSSSIFDYTWLNEVLASCVITSTTGIPSLIRLLLDSIPMCFIVFDSMSMLSPLPAQVGLYTPIPQALSGGVLDVE